MIREPCNIALNCHNLKNGEKKYFPESRFHKQNILWIQESIFPSMGQEVAATK